MNRDEKGQVTARVVERLQTTETVVCADFRGLTVAELAELRQRLRDADAEMSVVKNTLSRRAANETGREALLPYLQGPTGLVWVNGDPARAAKVLNDFAKEHQEVFSIRGGVLGAEDLPTASIVRLAALPSKDVLLARLAGGLIAPISGLAGTLSSLISTFARTLEAVKGSGALAPGEAPAEAPEAAAVEVDAPAEVPAVEPTEPDAPAEAPEVDADAAVEASDADAPADAPVADEAVEEADAAPADEPVAEAAVEEADAPADEPVAEDTPDAPAEEPAPENEIEAAPSGDGDTPES